MYTEIEERNKHTHTHTNTKFRYCNLNKQKNDRISNVNVMHLSSYHETCKSSVYSTKTQKSVFTQNLNPKLVNEA